MGRKGTFSFFSLCTIYVITWCLYGVHWYDVFPNSTIDTVSGLLLGVTLLISLWCLGHVYKWKKPKLFIYINLLLVAFTIYGFFYLLFGETYYVNGEPVSKASYIISCYRSFLSIYAFYYFTKKGYINEDSIKIYILIIAVSYLLYDFLYSQRIINNSIYGKDFTNNLGYIFLFLMPAAMFFKKTLIRLGLLFVALICVLISMKRGAILIGVLLLIWILYGEFKTSSKKTRVWLTILAIVAVGYGASYFIKYYEEDDFAQARIEQTLSGDSSGRDEIYGSLIHYYLNDYNIFQQLFGNGPDASLGINGRDAHNDWLDLLCCQGLFGVVLYLMYWGVLYKTWRRMRKDKLLFYAVGSVFIIQLIRSAISMSYATLPTCGALLLGYSLALYYQNKQQVTINKISSK